MPYRDLHSKPFDETTITKLEVFQDYSEAWIPTFVMQPGINEIHVFDFFAGPGFDKNGVSGSPIRLLENVKSQLGNFFKTQTKVVLHFNEFEPGKKRQDKFDLLKQNCDEYFSLNPSMKHFATINYYNKDAKELFFDLLPTIKEYPSLVYLDQNGVRFIAKEFIDELEKLYTVDFIYFVSSSYFWRFGGTEEFQKVLQFDFDELKKKNHFDIHREVLLKLKENLPEKTRLKLFPFSLKKGPNIYGIIFGAKHYRAVDKFLDITWRRNESNGEADFDIDGEKPKPQLDLFSENKLTKIGKFKEELKALILNKTIKTNEDALLFAYESGHLPRHAVEVIKALKNEGKISYESKSPCVNYGQVFKNKNIIKYKLN
jgi:three-Cys-motif partner protein